MADSTAVNQTTGISTPGSLAHTLESAVDTFPRVLADHELAPADIRGFDECLGEVRRVSSALRAMSLLQDATGSDTATKHEEAIKSIVLMMGRSIGELAKGNRHVREQVGEQVGALEEIVRLPPGKESAVRLVSVAQGMVEATNEMGAHLDTMAKQVDTANQRVSELEVQLEEARQKVLFDQVTRVHSRVALHERLLHQVSNEDPTPWCFAIADIDRFKSVNDTFGHTVGDAVLLKVAQALERSLRQHNDDWFIGRYGGEEFAMILTTCSIDEAATAAEHVREAVGSSRWKLSTITDTVLQATVSVGVTQYQEQDSVLTIVHRADEALYEAKNGGRDQVRVAAPTAP